MALKPWLGPFALKLLALILLAAGVNMLPLFYLRTHLMASIQSSYPSSPSSQPDDVSGFRFSRAQQRGLEAAALGAGAVVRKGGRLTRYVAPDAALPTRLELLHIPKTGGSMLEVLGGKKGVRWGACHFR